MASRKKTLITFDQHVEIGKELKRIQAYWSRLTVQISNAYPERSTASKLVKPTMGIKGWGNPIPLNPLREELSGCLFREFPEMGTDNVYFGTTDRD